MDRFQSEIDIAYARMQEAFSRLKLTQMRVERNREALNRQAVKSPAWTENDREQNELQEEWRTAYRTFALETRHLLNCVNRAEAEMNVGL